LSVEEQLQKLESYAEELGLNLAKPEDRFKWFLASILFAKRISADIAKNTFHKFVDENLTTPDKILEAGWDRLVEVLDSGGYVRYDFSTASNLLGIMKELKEKYGNLENLHRQSINPADLEKKLQEFRGIGPVGVNIFLRELRGTWGKAKPKPSRMAVETAQKISVKDMEPYESALVRLNLEFCKKHKCAECLVENYCRSASKQH
jgi:endonuclease III